MHEGLWSYALTMAQGSRNRQLIDLVLLLTSSEFRGLLAGLLLQGSTADALAEQEIGIREH